ncbi:MAG: hypothetical protein GYA16_01920 [Spirochaetes bacterium]|nr:hypothetical protein [Spirochaetota bacterium]NMB63606.1 hypothetical protein [Spirochaetota bacterium]
MDINSIKQVQDRIKEIKNRFKTIQNTYAKVSPSTSMVMADSKAAEAGKVTATVQENSEPQKNNTTVKMTEEILKNVLNSKKENTKETLDVQQIQNLLQKAITQYTSNGKIFNIEE